MAALQRLRARAEILAVSGFYESRPAEGAEGPAFLNAAASVRTALTQADLATFIQAVEASLGRAGTRRLAARAIDVDILVSDGEARPDLERRPYDVVPLAEIAPQFARAAAACGDGVRRKERSLSFQANRQEDAPEVRISLNRVGVSRVRRILRLNVDGTERAYNAELAMVADLGANKAGVHMSRFSEILEEAALDVLARDDAPTAVSELVETIGRAIVDSQRALRADVRLRADFGLERWTPVSGKRGEETYTLVGIAHADERGTRRVVGVEAEGMTACPCAQLMVREHSVNELLEAGFSAKDAQRALDALPVATHNQRGRGAVLIGARDGQAPKAEDLVEIVESSMSSETYDLLKRPDEFFVVNKAHHNPKFVEDVVRGILAQTLEVYADFDDDAFVFASQVNYESIHKHDAFAEGYGTFGELRGELAECSDATARSAGTARTDLAGWLGTRPSGILV